MHAFLPLVIFASTPMGAVRGTVTEAATSRTLEGVVVEVSSAGVTTISDSSGHYLVPAVSAGWHRIRYSRLGYRTVEVQVFVSEGSTTTLDVTLAVHPLPLPKLQVIRASEAGGSKPSPLLGNDAAHAGARVFSPDALENHPILDTPDLLRTLATMPDFASRPDAGGALHVRGGSGDQNLFLLDGAPILNPYHAEGMAGTINPDAVGVVEVFAGVAPAEYGGRLSSVVSMETRQPNQDRFNVRAGADGFVSYMTVDGPLVPRRTGALLSVRRSNGGILASLHDHASTAPRFWDLLATTATALAGGSLKMTAYHSADRLAFDASGAGGKESVGDIGLDPNRFRWSGGTDALAWHRTAPGLRASVTGWRATAHSDGRWLGTAGSVSLSNGIRNLGARAAVGVPLATGWLRVGVGAQRYRIRYRATRVTGATIAHRQKATQLQGSMEWHKVFRDRVAVTSGARSTLTSGSGFFLEPRITVSVAATPSAVISAGYARSRQIVQSLGNEESVLDVAVPLEFPGVIAGGGNSAGVGDQLMLSLRMDASPGTQVGFDLYSRRMSGLVLVAPVTSEPTLVGQYQRGRGTAAGLQLSVAADRDRWQSLLGYHLGIARRSTPTESYLPGFQRSHWVVAGASYRASRHLALRSSVWAGSGNPSSALTPGFQWESNDPVLGQGDLKGTPTRLGDEINGLTLPLYLRIDLGLRGEWQVTLGGRTASLGSFLSVENLLGRHNPLAYRRDPGTGALVPIPIRSRALNAGLRLRY